MALYLGSDVIKINLNGVAYRLNLFSTVPISDAIRLLSSDGYILKDSTGVYITAKSESE